MNYIISTVVSVCMLITGWVLLEVIQLKLDIVKITSSRFTAEEGRELSEGVITLNSNIEWNNHQLNNIEEDIDEIQIKLDHLIHVNDLLTYSPYETQVKITER